MFRCSNLRHRRRAAIELSLLLAAPGAWALDQAARVQLGASVLKIEVQRVQGGYSLGSGVAVAADTVVTNCHVTRDGKQIAVLRGGLRRVAAAQARNIEHDLCVLSVPGLGAPPVEFSSTRLEPGQPVSAIGYTGGLGLQSSEGEVVALHKWDGQQVIQSSNFFTSGASGGGLFDSQLRLVGILTFRLRGGEAHYFSAPADWLKPMLDGRGAFAEVAPFADGGRAFWEQPEALQPLFLKAAVYQRERRWSELEPLAASWLQDDAADPEPWYLQGLALQQLGRLPESQRSLERSVEIEPASREAWFQLGVAYARQGLRERALAALARLQSMNSDLAHELERAIALH